MCDTAKLPEVGDFTPFETYDQPNVYSVLWRVSRKPVAVFDTRAQAERFMDYVDPGAVALELVRNYPTRVTSGRERFEQDETAHYRAE